MSLCSVDDKCRYRLQKVVEEKAKTSSSDIFLFLNLNHDKKWVSFDLSVNLKVPKCEIFDPFFYTNKFYLGWDLKTRIFFF